MKPQTKEHYPHDICPKCEAESVPAENVPDQALRGCPKCGQVWVENFARPPITINEKGEVI